MRFKTCSIKTKHVSLINTSNTVKTKQPLNHTGTYVVRSFFDANYAEEFVYKASECEYEYATAQAT